MVIGVENGSTTTANLTREQVQTTLVEPLTATSVFLAAGPHIVDTDGSPVRLPSIAALDVTGSYWTAENAPIAEIEPSFGEITLMPSTMESIKTITRYSNELARQAVIGLDTALQNRLVADVATRLDKQFLSADDGKTEGERVRPAGIFSYASANAIDADGALTLDKILAAQGQALAANANVNAMRLLITPADYIKVRGAKDGDDRYMLEPDATKGAVGSILGTPVIVSPHVPAGKAALVDFSQIVVARDLAPTVTILRERYADYDQQAIRVVTRYDAAALQPEAIVPITGITA